MLCALPCPLFAVGFLPRAPSPCFSFFFLPSTGETAGGVTTEVSVEVFMGIFSTSVHTVDGFADRVQRGFFFSPCAYS